MREELETLLALVRDGRIKPVIERVFPLDDVNAAFALLEERRSFGKVVLTP
jgi:alcohol dehydrogenase